MGVLLTFSAFALAPFEVIKNVKILRVYPQNVIMLSRGLEDGISRNDHIKISNETNGFAGRAICLKAKSETSYWKIYRVPNTKFFSKDYTYHIAGLADREIPHPVIEYRDQEQIIAGLEEEKDKENIEVTEDLPKDLSDVEAKRIQTLYERKVRAQVAGTNELSSGTAISLRNQSQAYRTQKRSLYQEKALLEDLRKRRVKLEADDDLFKSFNREKDELFNTFNSYKTRYVDEPMNTVKNLERQKNDLMNKPQETLRNLEYQKNRTMNELENSKNNLMKGFDF